ncbi:MAG: hypothetical protein KDB22_07405 [Planctomycetales bacterium]|nr:hypothetical protein [Planctomycetales bacterium]
MTGKALADDDVRVAQQQSGSVVGMVGGMGGEMAHESPERESFALPAHVVLAMLFGFLGSKFARWAGRPDENDADEPRHECASLS